MKNKERRYSEKPFLRLFKGKRSLKLFLRRNFRGATDAEGGAILETPLPISK
jgi:hypothetical protein